MIKNNTNMQEVFDRIDENTWIISDTHIGHKNILEFEPCRLTAMRIDGYEADEHDQWIIHNWNSVVKPDSNILHLGDFAFKQLINKDRTIKLFKKYKHLTKEEFGKFLKGKRFEDL